ncbi:MAG: hypothetical protein NC110_04545, partial [Ruminococcus sp.]|nr:hypothetical protein [Ruminococcus sp.]
MEQHNYDESTTQYQMYYGKQIADSVKLNAEQAKNTSDGITYRIPSLLSVENADKKIVLAAFD